MGHLSGKVPTDPGDIRPLLIGAKIPELTLKTVDGDPFDLNSAVSERPTLLVFYRGGW